MPFYRKSSRVHPRSIPGALLGRGRFQTACVPPLDRRATPLSPTHVNALNSIQIEFSPKDPKEKAVINAWKDLHDHFAVPITDENQASWHSKRWDLHINLLHLMGQTLGYNFTKSNLRQDIYTPLGITDLETQERTMRDNLADIIAGKKDLPVLVKKVD